MRRLSFFLAGFTVFVGVAAGVRSAWLPAATVAVFIEYADGSAWKPAPASPLFGRGVLQFAGFEPVQLAGSHLGTWHEVAIIDFQQTTDFEAFARDIASLENVARYHLLMLAPETPELLWFTNWRLESFRDDPTIVPGERVPIEEVVPDEAYLAEWQSLFAGRYRDSVVMLNLMVLEDEPRDPTGNVDADSEALAEELYERYSEKATRLLGRLGGRIEVLGSVDRVVVGPPERLYDTYAFVFYPTVDVFEVMFTAAERVEAQVFQRAGLSEASAGYWVKPYPGFTSIPM